MCTIELTHVYATEILPYLDNVNSYSEFNNAIVAVGNDGGEEDDENDVKGAIFEVFFEYWAKRFGSDTKVGIHNVKDTSENKYEYGCDFLFTGSDKQLGLVQCKWRNPNAYRKYLGEATKSFSDVIDNHSTSKENSILFVNFFVEKDNENVFEHNCILGRNKKMRVIGKQKQEELILLAPTFWDDFRASVQKLIDAPRRSTLIEQLYEHQERAVVSCNTVLNGERSRGKIHCATGGGKSLIELMCARLFLNNPANKTLVIVAPTIDLVNQHISYFSDRNALNFPNLHIHSLKTGAVVSYKTSSDPTNVQTFSYGSTDEAGGKETLQQLIECSNERRLVIFTTYSSIKKCLKQFKDLGKMVGCIIFDEYHNLIQQQDVDKDKQKQFSVKWIKEIPAEKILFFSASVKRGRIVSATNEALFGPELINISYKELREKGLLVPRVNIIPIRLSNPKWSKTVDTLNSENLWTGINAVDCHKQAAATVVAYNTGCNLAGDEINLITFQDRVANCTEIQKNTNDINSIVRNTLINGSAVNIATVHAKVRSSQRKDIYGEISRTSGNILLQHSCATEGIDIPNLRAIMIGRKLSIIETQQAIGRIVRTDPADREKMNNGLISVNSNEGWKKYRSYVFLLCDGKNDEDYIEQLKDFVIKLQLSGLSEDDYQFADLTPERVSKPEDESEGENKPGACFEFERQAFKQIVQDAKTYIEDQEEQFLKEQLDDEIESEVMAIIEEGFKFSF